MTVKNTIPELSDVAARAAELARRAGADAAEVLCRDGSELTVKVRLSEAELVKEAGSRALGLRVFVDRRAAVTYTSDFTEGALAALAHETVALARLAEPDPANTLPDEDFASDLPELDLWDEASLGVDAATALRWAIAGEDAARQADPRVTNSDGATFSRTAGASAFANTAGFCAGARGTYQSFYVEPICDDADGKKRSGYWWSAARYLSALESPEAVGKEAARRTLAKLGSRKVHTCDAPIVFDPDAARALVGALFGVTNGSAWYRKSSYLLGREGQPCASSLVTIIDDPLIPRAPGSRPFDGDGLRSRRNTVVEGGILNTILCDTYTARKLGRKSTGSAGRGVGGSPGPTTSNLILQAGATPAADIVKGVRAGLYVTDMMGMGFNPVTGDFSRGAAGFWIENGELTYPVSEVTISANFDDIWKRVDAVGDDLDLRSSTAAPTLRVAHMTIAGR
jgi:PmbA protein